MRVCVPITDHRTDAGRRRRVACLLQRQINRRCAVRTERLAALHAVLEGGPAGRAVRIPTGGICWPTLLVIDILGPSDLVDRSS